MGREIITRNASETLELGSRLGAVLEPGDVVALAGPLGVGKTVLAKGIGKGLGVLQDVLSPSFNIVLEYEGRVKFRHIDFYRLGKKSEAYDIGIEEYLDHDAVAVVEWADTLPDILPKERLWLQMEFDKGNRRKISLSAGSPRFEGIIQAVS